ncbi:alpha/beta fold hydrolase [Streptomyces sp. NRRL S-87]|uniref:alpha/beta fold hydrolase n=1 Tax=Streptomyces sp. NRRL S-87 TaxID=1463920 RepID=UPI00099D41D2|nr:alpha/beta hydrolase [Streptomyces sp. NRRL S-87]
MTAIPGPRTLTELEAALRASFAADTCSPDDVERAPWTPENPAWGHCDLTALLVQDVFGGDLMAGKVFLGGEQQGFHMWNRLPGGVELDLTRDQFRRGQEVSPGWALRERPPGRLPRRWDEYQLLRRRVIGRLGPLRGVLHLADGRRLSYVDFGGTGRPVLALHGHYQEAASFARLARDLGPEWRLIAPDQRGHGHSDRAPDYAREGYVADAAALLEHLGTGPAVVLGHSLGGVNAYQLAARRPDLVAALVVEDIGAEVDADNSFVLAWPHRAPTRDALLAALGGSAPYVADAVREYADGWGLAFAPADMVASQGLMNGAWWADWTGSDCPALLVRGTRSGVLGADHAGEMVRRRPGTRLAELPAGHTVRATAPEAYAAEVRGFLEGVGVGVGL